MVVHVLPLGLSEVAWAGCAHLYECTSLRCLAALLASVAILLHATLAEARISWAHLYAPFVVSLGLLLLAIVRQAITFLENTRLLREREEARATTRAMRELVQRKELAAPGWLGRSRANSRWRWYSVGSSHGSRSS